MKNQKEERERWHEPDTGINVRTMLQVGKHTGRGKGAGGRVVGIGMLCLFWWGRNQHGRRETQVG